MAMFILSHVHQISLKEISQELLLGLQEGKAFDGCVETGGIETLACAHLARSLQCHHKSR